MEDFFTIIIRSNSKQVSTDNSNSCSIRLKCPSQYQYIQCYGASFYASFPEIYNTYTVELRVSDIDIYDSFDSSLGNLKTLAFENIGVANNADRANINFKCGNFNNKLVTFTLVNENGVLLTETVGGVTADYNRPWVLVMKCKGLTE